jgi:hypothetical protein
MCSQTCFDRARVRASCFGSSRPMRQSQQSPERSEGINPLAWSLSYRQLQIARLRVRAEVRFSDESRLFFHFCPGIATWSICCGVDPLTPGNSGGSERASLPARRPFNFRIGHWRPQPRLGSWRDRRDIRARRYAVIEAASGSSTSQRGGCWNIFECVCHSPNGIPGHNSWHSAEVFGGAASATAKEN